MYAANQEAPIDERTGYEKDYIIAAANAWAAVGVGGQFESSVDLCSSPDVALDPYTEQVFELYLAFYGRVGEANGVNWWAGQLANYGGNLDAIWGAFSTSNEYNRRYKDLSAQAYVEKLYRQMFNRDPDPGGLSWYLGQLSSGTIARENLALAMFYAAGPSDALVIQEKLKFARSYYRTSNDATLKFSDFLLAGYTQTVTNDANSLADVCGIFALLDEATQ